MKVVIELTGSPRLDGKVHALQHATELQSLMRHPAIGIEPLVVPMVTTGCVRWFGDEPVEIYVPENRLAEWKAEHDVEELT